MEYDNDSSWLAQPNSVLSHAELSGNFIVTLKDRLGHISKKCFMVTWKVMYLKTDTEKQTVYTISCEFEKFFSLKLRGKQGGGMAK